VPEAKRKVLDSGAKRRSTFGEAESVEQRSIKGVPPRLDIYEIGEVKTGAD